MVFTGDSPLTLLTGSSASLLCRVVAQPAVTAVTWYKNGAAVIRTSGRISNGTVDHPSLTISNVVKEDEGSYECNATNRLGTSGNTTILIVRCRLMTIV